VILDFASVAVGGGLGALARFGLLRWAEGRGGRDGARWDGTARGTVLANVIGCAVFGLWTAAPGAGSEAGAGAGTLSEIEPDVGFALDLLVLTGFCGGLTTFSTAVADGVRLRAVRSGAASLGYATATCAAGLVVLWLGLRFGA
jgi:CrcB protein